MASLSKMSKGDRIDVLLEDGDELFLSFNLDDGFMKERNHTLIISTQKRLKSLHISEVESWEDSKGPKNKLLGGDERECVLYNKLGFKVFPEKKEKKTKK